MLLLFRGQCGKVFYADIVDLGLYLVLIEGVRALVTEIVHGGNEIPNWSFDLRRLLPFAEFGLGVKTPALLS